MPVIIVDGQEHQVEAGKNLLEACLGLGLDLPYFCWHPAMGSIGACRQCALVQYRDADDQQGRIVMGCMTPVSDGAILSLQGGKAQQFRQAIIESLMLNHPHDCPVCAEGGECHLQDMTVMAGHRDRRYRGRKNTHRNQYLGPLIHHEMNRCISCYRCTRYYNDYAGGTDLAALASRDHVYFGRHEEGILESEFAGNLVEVCPTGVFTDKLLVHDYTRKWDLQSAPSVCTACAVGCNTLVGERYGKLRRVHNRFNADVNGYFLCDRGRFGARYVNSEQRLKYPGVREADGRYRATDHHNALRLAREWCTASRMVGIGSPRASVEANYLLRCLVGEENFSPGFSADEQALVNLALRLQRKSAAQIASLADIESADAVLILGEDVTHTAPRIALALRQSVRNRARDMAAELGLQGWQDAATRNLAQDERNPLYIASVASTGLADIAAGQLSLAPQDIARFGFTVAALIEGTAQAQSDSAQNEPFRALAEEVATILRGARRPLIVSGTGGGYAPLLQSAANIANALSSGEHQVMLSLAVPEANSIGQALLAGPDAPDLREICQRAASGHVDTAIVLENDLYRRDSREHIDHLLTDCDQVIVLDGIDNKTTSAASLTLPAASFAECEGTVVSLEGRAQRYYPVFQPAEERHPAWVWLLALLKDVNNPLAAPLHHFDDVTRACADAVPVMADLCAAAPAGEFRTGGVKVPRQPHRFSGRTAMRANVSVHEPRQPRDEESPLAFSMEGLNHDQPGSLLPYVWAPGWNSNQALHKFQSEVGGALRGGSGGVRLIGVNQSTAPSPVSFTTTLPPKFQAEAGRWMLVPRQRIFGSEELSALSPGISDLVEPGFLELHPQDAESLSVAGGDGLTIGGDIATLEVRLCASMTIGCVGYSAGHRDCLQLRPLQWVRLAAAPNWQRPAVLIGTDGGGRD